MEFIDDGLIKIVLIQTKDNNADVFTKNIVGGLYDKHTSDMVLKPEDIDKKSQGWLTRGRVLESVALSQGNY